jgi:hypothetical protein
MYSLPFHILSLSFITSQFFLASFQHDALAVLTNHGHWLTTLRALERCQLKDVVVSKPEKLDAPGITIFMLLCVIVYLLAFYSFLFALVVHSG